MGTIAARTLRGFRKPRAPRRLQLVETLPLGGKRQLMLIDCDGRSFLVGAGGDAISTVMPIAESTTADSADSKSSLIAQQSSSTRTNWSFLQ